MPGFPPGIVVWAGAPARLFAGHCRLGSLFSRFRPAATSPGPSKGVPPGAPWEALPLAEMAGGGSRRASGLAFCAPPECRPGLVVSVIDLKGRGRRRSRKACSRTRPASRKRSGQAEAPSARSQTIVSTAPPRRAGLPRLRDQPRAVRRREGSGLWGNARPPLRRHPETRPRYRRRSRRRSRRPCDRSPSA